MRLQVRIILLIMNIWHWIQRIQWKHLEKTQLSLSGLWNRISKVTHTKCTLLGLAMDFYCFSGVSDKEHTWHTGVCNVKNIGMVCHTLVLAVSEESFSHWWFYSANCLSVASAMHRVYSQLCADRVPGTSSWLYAQRLKLVKSMIFQVSGICNIYQSLLDQVMWRNQWHTGVQECHLVFKGLIQLNYNVLVFTHFYGMSVCIMTGLCPLM